MERSFQDGHFWLGKRVFETALESRLRQTVHSLAEECGRIIQESEKKIEGRLYQ